jgi:hypothetical protein
MSRVSYAMLEAGYIPGDLGAFKKEGGKIRLYDSSPPSSPTSQTVTNLTYPEWAKKDVQGIVENALTLAKQGYAPYKNTETGLPIERIAKFDPLQLTAQQAVSNIGPSQQLGPATQYATSAGLKAGAVQYDPMLAQTGSFTQPGVAGQYMSPYTQNVIDIQNREAARQSEIQRNQNQAQAVGQGAFGGSRSAIVEAERQRNLMQQQGDIQQKGQQAAYEQAQNLYGNEQQRALQAQQQTEQSRQYGAGLGLQGLSTQLQAAGQLGQLGGQQFQQQSDIINALNAAGAQRQSRDQQVLSQAYQDFLTQKQYPYQQIAFAKEMIAGVPQQTTQQVYQAPPSMLSQAAGLGLAGYGLFGMGKAAGGKIEEDNMNQGYPGLGELAMYNAMQRARG